VHGCHHDRRLLLANVTARQQLWDALPEAQDYLRLAATTQPSCSQLRRLQAYVLTLPADMHRHLCKHQCGLPQQQHK
jgi:hypothetical protein